MASTVKVAVAALIWRRSITAAARSTTRIGGRPARRLMERMLIHSDNRATDMLFKDLGGPSAVQHWLQQNGLTGFASTAPSPSC